jgi:hypothetical protein
MTKRDSKLAGQLEVGEIIMGELEMEIERISYQGFNTKVWVWTPAGEKQILFSSGERVRVVPSY